MNQPNPFKWRHFEAEIILLCVRWYLRYSAPLPRSRGNDAGTGTRGGSYHHLPASVQHYAPELEQRCRPHLKATNDSWRVDETSIKIRKTWMYLYRAVDPEGNTLEFLLSPTRDAEAAKRFFVKVLHSTARSAPGARPVEEPTPTADSNPTPSALRAKLSPAARQVVMASAVLGRQTTAHQLWQVADVGVQAGIEALEEAVRSGILREVVSGSGHPASYGFAQELMRQVVLTELGEARRQVLSQRAASRIEREAVKLPQRAAHALSA